MNTARAASRVAAGAVATFALAACSAEDATPVAPPPTVSADVEQETVSVAPETPEPAGDPLAACAALFDGGADSIVQRAPNLLVEVPESLDTTSAQPYMVMDSELRVVLDLAPSEMQDAVESIRAPFAAISAAVTAGDSEVSSDTSDVAEAVTDLMEECVDAGFSIEEAEESPFGESVTSSRGNLVKEIGQLAGITSHTGDPVVEFVVTDIVVDFACTSDWAEAPANGHYVGLELEITTTPELADEPSPEFWMSNHDFSAWSTEGKRVNDPVGNAYSCLSDSDSIPDRIGPDEAVGGWIVLDLPHDAGAIGYSWIGLNGGGWEWAYGG